MKKIHIAFLSGAALLLCATTAHFVNSLTHEKQMDDIFGCNAQAIDNFAKEQVQTGKIYSEHTRQTMLSIDVDACVERNMYEYSGHIPRYLPSVFQ